jgi:urease accessory protein
MVRVRQLLGSVHDPPFRDRRVVSVSVAWDEASRRRLRRAAADGTDVAIELDDGGYLADGVVLDDDGQRVLVVVRSPEPALIVRLDLTLTPTELTAQAVALGHAFGNQHVPVDVEGADVRIPLTTSETVARATVDGLGLRGAQVSTSEVALGRAAPLSLSHAHRR